MKVRRKRVSRQWWVYVFLLVIFYFAQPLDLHYSIAYLRADRVSRDTVETTAVNIETGRTGRRLALISLCSFAAASLFFRRRKDLRISGPLAWFSVMFVLWAFLSISWADDTSLALTRIVTLGIMCLAALAIAERFRYQEIIHFAFFSALIVLLLGFLCEVLLGTFQPLHPGYRFSGEMDPLYQAYSCGTLVIAALAIAQTSKPKRLLCYAVALVALFFMLLTKSRSVIAGVALGAIAYWSLVTPKWRKQICVALGAIGTSILVTFIVIFGGQISHEAQNALLLGRDKSSVATLTGRIPLWTECWRYIAMRPILGYGFGAFWTPERFEAIYDSGVGFFVPDVHNGVLDMALGTGIIGAGLTVLILGTAIKKALSDYRASHDHYCAFAYGFLLLYTVANLSLSLHLQPFISSFLAMVIIAKLGFRPYPEEHAS